MIKKHMLTCALAAVFLLSTKLFIYSTPVKTESETNDLINVEKVEGSANRDSRFDDRKSHSKRSDQAPGKSFDSKRSDDSRPRSFNKSTSSSSSFQKKDDRPFNRDDRSFKKDDRPYKKDDRPFSDRKREDGPKSEFKSYKKPEYKKDDRYKKS